MKLTIGDKAPQFSLPDQDGKMHALDDFKGKWVLIYFYPKDDTPGCTKEACDIRDNFHAFQKHDVVVLGISTNTVKSHRKFADKYSLPFTLLADEDKKIDELYDVWHEKKFMGRAYMGTLRTSFLIDPKGEIAKIYEKVKPEQHAQQILADIDELAS